MEQHPRINMLKPIIDNQRIILGSFPTWSLTDADPEKEETDKQKEEERIKNGDFKYHYGSSINQFWKWYEKYIDSSLNKDNIVSIQNSLKRNEIGITDVIFSCSRKHKSALDKHLTKRVYNHEFFNYPKEGEVLKILCTSKGVMNEMLLSSNFLKLHASIYENTEKSEMFQKEIVQTLNGNMKQVKKPIYRVLEINSGGVVECMCIPSPGSPFRRLIDFGHKSDNADKFLNDYLDLVFKWFMS